MYMRHSSVLTLFLLGTFLSCQSATGKGGNVDTASIDTLPVELAAASSPVASAAEVPSSPAVEGREKLTLAFTGDILMGTNYPDSSYVTRDRGRSLFVDCDSLLQTADVAIGNLEGTCYWGTQGKSPKSGNSGTSFIFRMPGDHAQRLVDAGFDAMGIANNHAGDFGQLGRELTQKTLREVGMLYSGQKGGGETTIIERDGIRYGYIAFAASCGNTNDLNDAPVRDAMIQEMRPKCDILIITFHGGAEGAGHAHVPRKAENFLGENRGDVYKFAHECIDRGADIVVGHGPHVPRAMELYKGHLIAYSLGNFCAPFRMSISGATGYAPLLRVDIDPRNGQFLQGRIHSFKQVKGVGPRLDKTNAAAHNIATLTSQDFPESGLDFADDGTLTVR